MISMAKSQTRQRWSVRHDGYLVTSSSALHMSSLQSPEHALQKTLTARFPRGQCRYFADNLLGHSPMAEPTPKRNTPRESVDGSKASGIPSASEVAIAGGIWNPTSTKRDKLAELKTELKEPENSLDDAATPEQTLDLYLADGLQWIVHTVDQTRLAENLVDKPSTLVSSPVKEATKKVDKEPTSEVDLPPPLDPIKWEAEEQLPKVLAWLQQQQDTITKSQLTRDQWGTYLEEATQIIGESLATLPPERYLRRIRDVHEVPLEEAHDGFVKQNLQESLLENKDNNELNEAGHKLLARYRLLLAKATCEHLVESWDTLTTLTDEALDRLAVQTEYRDDEADLPENGTISTLPIGKLNQLLKATLMGNAVDRLDAFWDLYDRSGDGLLEKTEMEQACNSAVAPVKSAILALFEEALDASPVRGQPEEDYLSATNYESSTSKMQYREPGWRERRREAKAKKRLLKSFKRNLKMLFSDEIEMPHRLRCIYAWADKTHQGNNVESVLIEASGWSGRKRYVELPPKISLNEFREAQQIHLAHLDRVGWEVMKSFREDLWMEQGIGRQNAELKRECAIFLLVVSIIDYGIIVM